MYKRFTAILCAIVLVITSVAGCGQTSAIQAAELISLGEKFLLEPDYEQAIVSFLQAIALDPMNPRGQTGASDAYAGRGKQMIQSAETDEALDAAMADFEAALALEEANAEAWLGLADGHIRKGEYAKAKECAETGLAATGDTRLADMIVSIGEGNIFDSSGNRRRTSVYDSAGALLYYHDFNYKANRQSSVRAFDAGGGLLSQINITYNAQNAPLQGYRTDFDGYIDKAEYTYDAEGRIIRINYHYRGAPADYTITEYGSNGDQYTEKTYSAQNELQTHSVIDMGQYGRLRENIYALDGTLLAQHVNEYDENGRNVKWLEYDGDGSLISYMEIYYDESGQYMGNSWYDGDGSIRQLEVGHEN